MIDNDRVESLLQEELDGVLRDADRDELNALIASDPRVADEQRQLRQLADALARLPLTATPPGFVDDIMARLPPPAAPVIQLGLPNAPTRKRRWAAMALAASLGALAVGLVFELEQGTGLSSQELSGTLLNEPTVANLSAAFSLADGPVTGTVAAQAQEGVIELSVDLVAAAASEITLSTEKETLVRTLAAGELSATWTIEGDLAQGVQFVVEGPGSSRREYLLVPAGQQPNVSASRQQE